MDQNLSHGIRLVGPFLPASSFQPWMEANRRRFAGVSSIQAQPIKPGLVVDAITSAALAAMTRARVVEISLRVRMIAI